MIGWRGPRIGWRGPLIGCSGPLNCWRGRPIGWCTGWVWLLVLCVLCVQSLASVLPTFGEAHHHETDRLPDRPHDPMHDRPASLPANNGHAESGLEAIAPVAAHGHRHATVERHRHGSPADGRDSVVVDDAIDQLLDDLMQRLGSVATVLPGAPINGPAASAFAPVRVAHPGTRLAWRPPDLPYRPPIA